MRQQIAILSFLVIAAFNCSNSEDEVFIPVSPGGTPAAVLEEEQGPPEPEPACDNALSWSFTAEPIEKVYGERYDINVYLTPGAGDVYSSFDQEITYVVTNTGQAPATVWYTDERGTRQGLTSTIPPEGKLTWKVRAGIPLNCEFPIKSVNGKFNIKKEMCGILDAKGNFNLSVTVAPLQVSSPNTIGGRAAGISIVAQCK